MREGGMNLRQKSKFREKVKKGYLLDNIIITVGIATSGTPSSVSSCSLKADTRLVICSTDKIRDDVLKWIFTFSNIQFVIATWSASQFLVR